MQIHEYLELDVESNTISCMKCDEATRDGDENYKRHVALKRLPVHELDPAFSPTEENPGPEVVTGALTVLLPELRHPAQPYRREGGRRHHPRDRHRRGEAPDVTLRGDFRAIVSVTSVPARSTTRLGNSASGLAGGGTTTPMRMLMTQQPKHLSKANE